MSEEITRDLAHYSPTVHAVQQSKDRGIDWPEVAETIKEGRVKPSHKEHTYLFIRDVEYKEYPLCAVCNVKDGDIITVEWRRGENDPDS